MERGSSFVRALGFCSVQLCSSHRTALLPPLSSSLKVAESECVTIAAGFPHFAVNIWRVWGRDTFISLPGLLLLTERLDDAKSLCNNTLIDLSH